MATKDTDILVTQSLLDRLIDRDPKSASEPAMTRAQSVRLLKASLRRDLEWLLNTRRIATPADPALTEVNRSLYHYGLPDFSAMSMHNPKDKARLFRELERTIAYFEPRLAKVRVIPIESSSSAGTRLLRFQIEGLLMMDPAPEHISFDTLVHLSSGDYAVKGDRI